MIFRWCTQFLELDTNQPINRWFSTGTPIFLACHQSTDQPYFWNRYSKAMNLYCTILHWILSLLLLLKVMWPNQPINHGFPMVHPVFWAWHQSTNQPLIFYRDPHFLSLSPINRSTILLEQILQSYESILLHPTLNFEFAPASESDVTQSTDQPWISDGAPRFLSFTPINRSTVDFLWGPPFF